MTADFKPYEGPEPYIFVSYSHRDSETVIPLLNALNAAGYRVWYDEGIPWTSEWPMEIARHLNKCAICIAFHSKEALNSKYCRKEIHFALKYEKPILSAYLEDISLPLDLDLELSIYQQVKIFRIGTDTFVRQLEEESAFSPCMIVKSPTNDLRVPKAAETGLNITDAQLDWHNKGGARWTSYNSKLVIVKALNATGETPDFKPLSQCKCAYYSHIFSAIAAACSPLLLFTCIFPKLENLDGVAFIALLIVPFVPVAITRMIKDYYSEELSSPWSDRKISFLEIRNGITTIGSYTFESNKNLTSVVVPDSVTYIGEGAFAKCEKLTAVEVPANVNIHPKAFPPTTQIIRRPSTET